MQNHKAECNPSVDKCFPDGCNLNQSSQLGSESREELQFTPFVAFTGAFAVLFVWFLFGWLGLLVLFMSFVISFIGTKAILTKFGIFPNLIPVGHFQLFTCGSGETANLSFTNRGLPIFKSSSVVNSSVGYKICLICGDISCDRHPESHSISLTPWKSLLVQEDINQQLEKLVNQLVEYFVNSWYKSLLQHKEADLTQSKSFIETNNRFITEVKEIVRFLLSSILLKIHQMSPKASQFIMHSLVKSIVNHATVFIKGKRSAKSAQFIEETVLREYRDTCTLHPALKSQSSQIVYLRQISDLLLPFIVPPKYISSAPVRSLLKEILFGVILNPIVQVSSQPESINKLLVALSSNEFAIDGDVKQLSLSYVELLRDLSNVCSVKSSSSSPKRSIGHSWPLGIPLKYILSDQQMLFLFMQFLKQEGAVNLIQFYLAAKDLTEKLCNPELTQDQLVYLHREAQSVYNSFIHPKAVDLIIFTNHSTLECEFSSIINCGKINEIEKLRTCGPLLDAIYDVSNQLEQIYCGLFFSTSSFMKLVAGPSAGANTLPLPSSSFSVEKSSPDELTRGRLGQGKSHRRQTSMSSIKKVVKESFWSAIDDGVIPPSSSSYHDLSSYRSASLTDVDKISLFSQPSDRKSSATESIVDTNKLGTGDSGKNKWKSSTSLNDPRELKDMKNWQVTVPKVETRLDHNLKYFNVFIVKVNKELTASKADAAPIVNRSVEDGSTEAGQWIVERRDHEFYALESKLKEFHGDSLVSFDEYKPLSVNRNWQTLIAGTSNQRQSLDSKRIEFQSYLSNLVKCEKLKGSQLVYNFLSKADEFTADSLSLRKMIRSVPTKLTLEKGQNLDQFVSRLISRSLESSYHFSITDDQSPNHNCTLNGLTNEQQQNQQQQVFAKYHGSTTLTNEDDLFDGALEVTVTEHEELPNDDHHLQQQLQEHQHDHLQQSTGGTREEKDACIAFDFLLWFLFNFMSLDESHFIVRALIYLEVVIRSTFESLIHFLIYILLGKTVSSVPFVLKIIRYLNQSMEEKIGDLHPGEKIDHKELHKQASDSLINWLKGIPFASSLQQPAYLFFSMTQYSMLNRQLIFMWMDDLIGFYFPQITQKNGDSK